MKDNKAYEVKDDTIIINRDLTNLDIFVKDFLKILKAYQDYLIVSGFVSIATGRVRGTEDIDCLIMKPQKENFKILFNKIIEGGFWCYQGETFEEVFKYVEKMNSIRFARNNELFPNMEIIFIDETKKVKYFEFTHPQKIMIKDFLFKIPPIEFEILYKENILCGKKDIADAKHREYYFQIF